MKYKVVVAVAALGGLIGGPAWALSSSATPADPVGQVAVEISPSPEVSPTSWHWDRGCGPRKPPSLQKQDAPRPSESPRPWWKWWSR